MSCFSSRLFLLLKYTWFFFFASRRRHTSLTFDWSSDVCSSDLTNAQFPAGVLSHIQRANGVSSCPEAPTRLRLALRNQVRWISRHSREIGRQAEPLFQTAKFLQWPVFAGLRSSRRSS